jgi:hypothetical protein
MGEAILQNVTEVLQFCNQEKCLFFLVTSRTRVSLHPGLRVGYNDLQIKIRNNFGQETTGGKDLIDLSALAYKFRVSKQYRATLADTYLQKNLR